MHPILVNIPESVAHGLGYALFGLAPLYFLYTLWRMGSKGLPRDLKGLSWPIAFSLGMIVGGILIITKLKGGLPIYSYGVMLGLSFVGGWYICLHFAGKNGIDRQKGATALLLVILMSIVGARLLYVIINFSRFSDNIFGMFNMRQGGLVAYGGMIGGTLTAYIYLKLRKINFWEFADYAAPGIALGLGVTRFGCFMYGCDFGKRTDLPWGIRFPGQNLAECLGAPAFELHCKQGLLAHLSPGGPLQSLHVHPTQLYMALSGWLCFGILMLVLLKFRKFYGQVFVTLVLYYSIARFVIEYFRDDPQRGTVGIFSTSQFIGILLFVFAAGLLFYLRKRQRIQN